MTSTYNELYMAARRRLRAIGVEEDQLEAREILCFASGKTRQEFFRDRILYASEEIEQRVDSLLRRREAGEPVAYLLGEWEFYGLPLEVSRDVLIPRADTELLAERGILRASEVRESGRVLDLCTGTGCVGLAIASQVSGCRVVLGDISPEAIGVAKRNIRRLNLRETVSARRVDARQGPGEGVGTFDVIVSNPPYVRSGDMAGLDPSVRDYEPHLALDGGGDGLEFYRSISALWKSALRPGGWLIFEVGYDQALQAAQIMEAEGFRNINVFRDGGGVFRVVEGCLPTRQEAAYTL